MEGNGQRNRQKGGQTDESTDKTTDEMTKGLNEERADYIWRTNGQAKRRKDLRTGDGGNNKRTNKGRWRHFKSYLVIFAFTKDLYSTKSKALKNVHPGCLHLLSMDFFRYVYLSTKKKWGQWNYVTYTSFVFFFDHPSNPPRKKIVWLVELSGFRRKHIISQE